MVFLKESLEDENDMQRLSQALARSGEDRQAIEKSFNFFDVSFLFGRRFGDTTDEEDAWLLERLAQMWYFRLHQLFPDRSFRVEILTAQQSGDEPGVLFYQQQAQVIANAVEEPQA